MHRGWCSVIRQRRHDVFPLLSGSGRQCAPVARDER
jgi:hypothetical protein